MWIFFSDMTRLRNTKSRSMIVHPQQTVNFKVGSKVVPVGRTPSISARVLHCWKLFKLFLNITTYVAKEEMSDGASQHVERDGYL